MLAIEAEQQYHRTILVLLLLLNVFTIGCSSRNEVSRTTNPVGSVDAVIVERETDLADPSVEVFLIPQGDKLSGQPVFRADKVVAMQAIWESSTQLVVSANFARISKNLPSSEVVVAGGRKENISIRYGIEQEVK